MNKSMQQTLALAGVAQAAYLCHQTAHHGVVSPDRFHCCLDSLFVMQPERTEDVYGGVQRLSVGLEVLKEILEGGDSLTKSPDIMRYIMGLLHIESKLRSQPELMSAIVNGLEDIGRQFPDSEQRHGDAVIYRIGELYQNTISTLRHRIQVKGDYRFLSDDLNAARIRSLLLAGVRSAVLWRQLGGRRWLLMMLRRQLREDAIALLQLSRSQ